MRRVVFIIVGVGLSILFLILAAKGLDWDRVANSFLEMDVLPWLPLAVGVYLTGQLLRGLRLRMLVSRRVSISPLVGSNVVIVGYAVNAVLPARMGEFARAGLLTQRTGLPYSHSLSVNFLERVLDGVAILTFLLVTTLIVPASGWVSDVALVATVALGAASFAILLAVINPEFLMDTLTRLLGTRLIGAVGHRFADRVLGITINTANSVAFLRKPSDAARVGLLSILIWTTETVMFLLLLPAFGISPSFWWAALTMSITNLGILIPSAPGYVGSFHFFCMQALVSVGVDPATAIAFAVAVHLAMHIPIIIWGIGVMAIYGVKLGSATSAQKQASAQVQGNKENTILVIATMDAEPERASVSIFLTRLIEAIIPLESAGLTPSQASQVLAEVSEFVSGQLNSLPKQLQIMLSTGFMAFRVSAWLRYFGSFSRLDLERREKLMEAWTYGPVRPARLLFKAARATALLCFYENQHVTESMLQIEPEVIEP